MSSILDGVDLRTQLAGTNRLELDPEAIRSGQCVVIIDDLLATGGTAEAAGRLVRMAGGVVEHALFVIDLPDLGGARCLEANGIASEALVSFPGH